MMKKKKELSAMNLFELSVIGVMPRDIYHEIRSLMGLALTYLEDGAVQTSKAILQEFLGDKP
jgi:hypothetical protein